MVSERDEPVVCDCGVQMKQKYSFRVNAGNRQYARAIVSDSLAMHPDQIPEHRRMFPNIEVTPEGQPVFDNFTDHEAYLKKCNIQKLPQRKRISGKKI
jgi:hypothetical protein